MTSRIEGNSADEAGPESDAEEDEGEDRNFAFASMEVRRFDKLHTGLCKIHAGLCKLHEGGRRSFYYYYYIDVRLNIDGFIGIFQRVITIKAEHSSLQQKPRNQTRRLWCGNTSDG